MSNTENDGAKQHGRVTRDDIKKVYQVHHAAEYGFGGDTSPWIAVEKETNEKIIGWLVSPMSPRPDNQMTVMKANVAGWQEDPTMHHRVTEALENAE